MKKTTLTIACVVAALLAPVAVMAGYKATQVVVTNGSTYGYGAVGDARNSANSVEYIGCQTYVNVTGNNYFSYCYARNSANQLFGCYSNNDQRIVQTVGTITDFSNLYFAAASNGGPCTYIEVNNYSYWRPVTP